MAVVVVGIVTKNEDDEEDEEEDEEEKEAGRKAHDGFVAFVTVCGGQHVPVWTVSLGLLQSYHCLKSLLYQYCKLI